MKKLKIAAVALVVVIVAAIGGYFAYQNSLQPNIQATAVSIAQPLKKVDTSNVINQGRVSGTGNFDYTAAKDGTYSMVFDNSFSFFSSKSVAVTYSSPTKSDNPSFDVGAGAQRAIAVPLNTGQKVSGTFRVSGGSGNDVNFYIQGAICSESVSFSLSLVNAGNVKGFAEIGLQADGKNVIWSNKYFIDAGQQTPVSGTVSIANCDHSYKIVVLYQEKA